MAREAGLSQRAVSARLRRPINFAHLVESGERTLSVYEFIEYVSALARRYVVFLDSGKVMLTCADERGAARRLIEPVSRTRTRVSNRSTAGSAMSV